MHPIAPKFREGQRPSARVLNRAMDQLFATANLSASWPLVLEQGLEGTHLSIDLPRPQLCRVLDKDGSTDEQPAYTCLPCFETANKVSALAYSVPFANDSSLSTLVALETNSNPAVPTDGTALVWVYLSTFTGYYYFNYESRVIFAKINSGTNPYAWTEQRSTATGAWETPPNALSGTTTVNPAYEMNDVATVAANTMVVMYRAYTTGRAWVQLGSTQKGNAPTNTLHEKQSIVINNAVAGTFTLTFNDGSTSQTTAAIAFDAVAGDVETAIEALSNVTAVTVTGTGTTADPFIVEFLDTFNPYALMTVTFAANLASSQEWTFSAGKVRTKVHGKLDAILNFDSSATMSVWEWNGSAEADTTENLTVYDWLLSSGQSISSGKKVTAFYDLNSERWYVDGAECS